MLKPLQSSYLFKDKDVLKTICLYHVPDLRYFLLSYCPCCCHYCCQSLDMLIIGIFDILVKTQNIYQVTNLVDVVIVFITIIILHVLVNTGSLSGPRVEIS